MSVQTVKSKLPQVGTSIFTVMSRMAQEHNAINLSQGFPDFPCDNALIQKTLKYMQLGHNQYAPMAGLPVLRTEISKLVAKKYDATYDAEQEITITSGATEALFCAIMSLVHEGDEVLIIEPAYDCYVPAVQLAGGTTVAIGLEYPNYTINWDAVKRVINRNTRVIILNTPHNPTGMIWSEQDMANLEKLVKDNNIFIISDEVYEHIVFDNQTHQSVARYPNLRSRSMIISSFGKTFHVTGWKVGYCLAPEHLTREFRKVHQFVTFSTATPFQAAIAEYMQEDTPIQQLSSFYQEKRDYFLELMKGTQFKPLHSAGTYFQLMSYAEISDEKDTDFCERLVKEHGVAAIPVSVFYRKGVDNKVVRFCFAKDFQTLERAADRLRKV